MNRAFTLVETLVYLGLLSLLMAGSLVSAFAIAQASGRNRIEAAMLHEGMYLVRRARAMVQDGTAISLASSTPYAVRNLQAVISGMPGAAHDPERVQISFTLLAPDGSMERAFSDVIYADAP